MFSFPNNPYPETYTPAAAAGRHIIHTYILVPAAADGKIEGVLGEALVNLVFVRSNQDSDAACASEESARRKPEPVLSTRKVSRESAAP